MAEGASRELRYKAFLSYSHKDSAAAGHLHRRLESYSLPRRLVGMDTERGPVPERLWPIFRDREELPAATDLSETVRQALAESGALVILCSPNSVDSLWVGEEIETFRRLNPDRPILAAILDGDPPDCFPSALRAYSQDGTWHEPLATDLRRGRDGERLGLLKLVAGITGVGLDSLVQRDAQRRIRRVTAVTAMALIAMLAMAAMTLVAFDARREAEQQRAEAQMQRSAAEGQIEFMLTDLRTRLREVGRLDIMRSVNARALEYYDAQRDVDLLPADSRLRRARILRVMGEDGIRLGNLPAAEAALRESYRVTSQLLAGSPTDPERLLEHARSEFWIGRLHELQDDWPRAHARYLRFAALADRLIAAAPDDYEHMMEVAWSAIDLGNVQLNGRRDYPAAQRWYERAVAWFGRASRARPGDERPLRAQANALGWLADTFYMRSQWGASLESRLQQFRIAEGLYRRNPANTEDGYRLALAHRAVAASMAQTGNQSDARHHLFEAYGWSRRLVRHDPRNAEWLLFRALVDCHLYFGRVGLPPGTTRARLRALIDETASELRTQGNPRVTDLSRCLSALR